MELIKRYSGNQAEVWAMANEFLHEDQILVDAVEQWSATTFIPVELRWGLWVHGIHTGAKAKFLVAIVNNNISYATANLYRGEAWEIGLIMDKMAGSVRQVFPKSNFRERRSLLMDIGKAVYNVLSELNTNLSFTCYEADGQFRIIIDPYMALLDEEWIEERML